MSAEQIQYLKSLDSVRQQSQKVLECGLKGNLKYFNVDMSQLSLVVDYVDQIIKRDYKSVKDIPMHARWRHYKVGGVDYLQPVLDAWTQAGVDRSEQTRRLLDLFTVSVLLDAGAGNQWKFKTSSGQEIGRSEGLALAALQMFTDGLFSGCPQKQPFQADSVGLEALTVQQLSAGLQVGDGNQILGLEGRCKLLNSLGAVLKSKKFFQTGDQQSLSRPGCIYDYLSSLSGGSNQVDIDDVWTIAIDGFGDIWPRVATFIGESYLGDVWFNESIQDYVSFHKLSQWLIYSLIEPLVDSRFGQLRITNATKMTGLAEYRNGGLFVDFGVLKLKEKFVKEGLSNAASVKDSAYQQDLPLFKASHQVIIEWRSLTVALLDKVGEDVKKRYEMSIEELPLVNILEGGTWKAGREIAAKRRPHTKGPPIQILSDGTIF
ncbi:hypothetical protein MP228_001928 [Amoeboaphelidium protococcarum]|nr:hypothetical protein MP228_001928 [Amoeboaphelidium protococcarum]